MRSVPITYSQGTPTVLSSRQLLPPCSTLLCYQALSSNKNPQSRKRCDTKSEANTNCSNPEFLCHHEDHGPFETKCSIRASPLPPKIWRHSLKLSLSLRLSFLHLLCNTSITTAHFCNPKLVMSMQDENSGKKLKTPTSPRRTSLHAQLTFPNTNLPDSSAALSGHNHQPGSSNSDTHWLPTHVQNHRMH